MIGKSCTHARLTKPNLLPAKLMALGRNWKMWVAALIFSSGVMAGKTIMAYSDSARYGTKR
jgi:hypothetical protein